MVLERKAYRNCTHCGASQTQDIKTGFVVNNVKGKEVAPGCHQDLFSLACRCGILTKLCTSEDREGGLKIIWNSRPGKPIEPVRIEVNDGIAVTKPDEAGDAW